MDTIRIVETFADGRPKIWSELRRGVDCDVRVYVHATDCGCDICLAHEDIEEV